MQIRVSSRNCRAAVGAAVLAFETKIAEDRKRITEETFEALRDGAVHNGLHVDAAREKEMREMTDRDVEHMMQRHQGVGLLVVLNNFIEMLAYHQGDDIVIDDSDFNLLKPYLATAEPQDPALVAKDNY